ncbi:hypothetical protein ACHAXS_000865 [Conticribra weissflogii]
MYTASLAALVLFIPNQHILLSRPSSSSSLVVPSSLPNGVQEFQDARMTNDVNLQYLRHSSSRADEINMVKSILTTGNDTRNENFLLECSSRTNGEKLSKNLVSTSEFYSPKSKCKHDFRSSVVFFHVGKAGGGTAIVQLAGNERTYLQFVHPKPNPKIVQALKSHAEDTPDTLIINVRDPIDRFVSAFRWRLLRTCAPNDTREKTKRGGAHMVDTMCEVSPEQNEMLRETYGGSPNIMAEALCDDSTWKEKALTDAKMITHSSKLIEWLDFLIIKNNGVNISLRPSSNWSTPSIGITNFMALPLEKQIGSDETLFEWHIKQLAYTLIQKRYGKEAMENILTQIQPSNQNAKKNQNSRAIHSTSTYTNETAPRLTPLGECCLARYFEDDYRLIQSMLVTPSSEEEIESRINENLDYAEKRIIQPLDNVHPVLHEACSWGDVSQRELCRSDLSSILSRRAQYLDRSMGSCSNLVSKLKQ